jgi:hypothetical protein
MFVDVNKIQVLIDAAESMIKTLPEVEQYIHASDIAATLRKLIDDEVANLDKMAEEFEAQEVYDRDTLESPNLDAAIAANEMMEAGAAVMDWARQEKLMDDETRQIQDWPGGI